MFSSLLCKIFIHKPRIVTRFCNEERSKFINKEEHRLKPPAFLKKKPADYKEISVHCVDSFWISKKFSRLWKVGDKVYKRATSNNKALYRGDIKVSQIENIDIPNDKKLKLSKLYLGTHLNISPILEDFHEEDVRIDKLSDISHLHRRKQD